MDRLGFRNAIAGTSILPNIEFGNICEYNANGKYIKNYDLPMETYYTTVLWTWKQWRGRNDTEEVSKWVDVPHRRYQRTFIEPPSIEFILNNDVDGNSILCTPIIIFKSENTELIVHIVNLFLEIFHECEVFTANLERIIRAPIVRLNWDILPRGVMPWDTQRRNTLDNIVDQIQNGNRIFIRRRLELINSHNPDFVAIGRAGFHGYIIFGFNNLNIHILESMFHGNATYVFGQNWRILTQLTKADILFNALHLDRIIHNTLWFDRIEELFI